MAIRLSNATLENQVISISPIIDVIGMVDDQTMMSWDLSNRCLNAGILKTNEDVGSLVYRDSVMTNGGHFTRNNQFVLYYSNNGRGETIWSSESHFFWKYWGESPWCGRDAGNDSIPHTEFTVPAMEVRDSDILLLIKVLRYLVINGSQCSILLFFSVLLYSFLMGPVTPQLLRNVWWSCLCHCTVSLCSTYMFLNMDQRFQLAWIYLVVRLSNSSRLCCFSIFVWDYWVWINIATAFLIYIIMQFML